MSSRADTADTDEQTNAIGAGRYSLRIQSKARPENQQDISIPVVIAKTQETEKVWAFEWHSDKDWGNPVPVSGVGACSQSEIKFAFTQVVKHENLVTFHFIGTVADGSIAGGKFTCFVDGAKDFDGKWSLKRRVKEKDQRSPNSGSE